MLLMMSTWSTRRWVVAALAALGTAAFMALGTAMIENPVIVRKVATPWWAWLVLAITSVLSGLLVATYVREPGQAQQVDASARRGGIGGLLAYFAVGCPVDPRARSSGLPRSSRGWASLGWSCSVGPCAPAWPESVPARCPVRT